MSGLDGYTAVVTGGGRGIGAAAAAALAKAGAKVSVAARNEAQVVEVAAEIRKGGLEAFAFRCDVTDPRHVRDLALSASEAMGRIDILVNSAGTATSNPISRTTLAEWKHMMDVNATGTFLCAKAVYDQMKERRWGRIVNVASIAGLEGEKYVSAYTAAKHAVVGFTRALAAEAKGTGITVNAVCPGYVDTPLTDETIDKRPDRQPTEQPGGRTTIHLVSPTGDPIGQQLILLLAAAAGLFLARRSEGAPPAA